MIYIIFQIFLIIQDGVYDVINQSQKESNLLHSKTLYIIAGIALRFVRVFKPPYPANAFVNAEIPLGRKFLF